METRKIRNISRSLWKRRLVRDVWGKGISHLWIIIKVVLTFWTHESVSCSFESHSCSFNSFSTLLEFPLNFSPQVPVFKQSQLLIIHSSPVLGLANLEIEDRVLWTSYISLLPSFLSFLPSCLPSQPFFLFHVWWHNLFPFRLVPHNWSLPLGPNNCQSILYLTPSQFASSKLVTNIYSFWVMFDKYFKNFSNQY